MMNDEQLRRQVELVLKKTGSNISEPFFQELLSLIHAARKEAVDEYMNRAIKLEPHILQVIENDHADEGARIYARLCTAWCDMFGPTMQLTEGNLTELSPTHD